MLEVKGQSQSHTLVQMCGGKDIHIEARRIVTVAFLHHV